MALIQLIRGASTRSWLRVAGGAALIVLGSVLLSMLSVHAMTATPDRAFAGIAAALGAGVLWGTMYVPYRKAYLSGINPLSFVTIFTFGELGTMLFLAAVLPPGLPALGRQLIAMRSSIFWLLLGGFCWVIGDLFQQYATRLSASAAPFLCPIPISSGDSPGGCWSSVNSPPTPAPCA